MALIEDLLAAGLPITSIVETKPGNYRSECSRTLTPEEWAAYDQIVYPDRVRKASAKGEAALATALKTITPAEAVTYINNKVTDLTSAKAVLKLMARMLIALRDEVWPDLPES